MPEERIYATGAEASPLDLRTFTYQPTTARIKGGVRYSPVDIDDQHRVGICTAISMTMNAGKATGRKYSPDFQYLLQKKYIDKNWNEGSSALSALKVAYGYGLLPAEYWTFTDEDDRKLSYSKYIKKLQRVSDKEIEKLLKIAADYKIEGYAQVPVDRDLMAQAIDESRAGIIVRFNCGKTWYPSSGSPEPLQHPNPVISGHLVSESNYDGGSFRIANSWGTDWADEGTAYFLLRQYAPTEAWIPYYKDKPDYIDEKQKELESIKGQLLTILQQLVALLNLKVKN